MEISESGKVKVKGGSDSRLFDYVFVERGGSLYPSSWGGHLVPGDHGD